jgi:hypothetical protein
MIIAADFFAANDTTARVISLAAHYVNYIENQKGHNK